MDQGSSASIGIWREVPRQPKQRRCHECVKRTFYWLLEAEGAICRDCVNLRNMPKLGPSNAVVEENGAGKKSKSKIAPSKKIAILAKRAAGESKASISRDLHVAHNTVTKVLNETDFEKAIEEGRWNSVKLIPVALRGLELAMTRGDGPTSNRFLENVGVIGQNAIESVRANTVRQRGAINVLVHGGVTVQAAPAEKTINAEVVSSSAAITAATAVTTATSSDSPSSSQP